MLTEKFQERYRSKKKKKPSTALTRYGRFGALITLISVATYALLCMLLPRTQRAVQDITPMIVQQGQWLYQIILPSHPPLEIVHAPQADTAVQQLYLSVHSEGEQQELITQTLNKLDLQHSVNKDTQRINIGPIQNYVQLNRIEKILAALNCNAKHVLQH